MNCMNVVEEEIVTTPQGTVAVGSIGAVQMDMDTMEHLATAGVIESCNAFLQ